MIGDLIKGTTMIQQFYNGREIERTKDENMITNAYKRYQEAKLQMWSSVFMSGIGFYNIQSLRPYDLVQGILLFDTDMPTDPDTYVPISGNCIGHAGGDYAGSNPFRGDFNSAESGPINNGYRFVWDFLTDKANGTIKSVCLTTRKGGNQGYKNDVIDTSEVLSDRSNNNITKVLKVSDDFKTVYYQQGLGNVSKVYLRKLITPNLSAIGFFGSPKLYDDTSSQPYAVMPAYTYLFLEYVGNILYGLIYNNSTYSLVLKKYDENLVEIPGSSITLDNSANYPISLINNNFGIIGNTIYIMSSNNTLRKWNITTGAYIDSVPLGNTSYTYNVNTYDENNISLTWSSYAMLYNGSTFHGPVYEGNTYQTYKRISNTPLVLIQWGNYINVAYMGTAFFSVNNLSSAVEKRNTNTMKITYDITWS